MPSFSYTFFLAAGRRAAGVSEESFLLAIRNKPNGCLCGLRISNDGKYLRTIAKSDVRERDIGHVPPTANALAGFAENQQAHLLAGGMGAAWRAGNVVLKPSPGTAQATCLAETHINLPAKSGCRYQRPIPASGLEGGWEIDGWVAWSWIDGETSPARPRDIVLAARVYHGLIAPMRHNPALTGRSDPWARADRVAWGEAGHDYSAEYRAMLSPLLAKPPPPLANQRVHADLTGNVVFSPGQAAGIIDPTLYWRPRAFAEAVVLVDQCWFCSDIDLSAFADTEALPAMLRRAAARRIAEQPEQVAAHGKNADEALATARRIADWTGALLNQLGGD